MKQNKENETSLRRDSNLKVYELEKQVEKANETIKRMEMEMKNFKKTVTNEEIDRKLKTQDQATILTKAEQQKNFLIKQFTQQIEQLKTQLNGDNKIWIQRFDIRKKQYEVQLLKQKQESQRILHETKDKLFKQTQLLKQKLEFDLKQKINHYQEEKRKVLTQSQLKMKQTILNCQRQKVLIVQQKQCCIMNLQKKQTQQISKMNKSHQSIIASIKSQKRSEQHMHEETKKKMQVQKKALNQIIQSITNQLTSAKQQIQSLKIKNSDLKIQLQNQIQQNKLDNCQWQQKLSARIRAHESILQQLTTKHEQNATSILQSHFQHIEKLEFTLTILQTKNQQQKQLHNNQIEQIKQIYQQRPSRQQDLANMSHIQQRLMRKAKQVQILKNQLKWCRLQLDNKQEVYNKIFACQKPLMPSIHRDRKVIRFANSSNHRETKSSKMMSKVV